MLNPVQGVVDALMRDYCELVKQNQKLNEQLKSSESSSCDHTDHIEALQHENRMLRKKVDDISTAHQQNTCDSSDFHAEIESLKQKLAKRDKTIEKLMFTSKKQLAPKKCESIESTSNESIEDQNMLMHNNLPLRTRSDGCASYRSCVSTTNLSESEKRDTAKIQALKNGYKELSKIISEKYAQLRKQRMKIAELMKQLEKCARQESTIEQLQQEKEQLENRLKHLPNSIDTKMAIKKQLEKCSTDVEQLKRREQILQQKLSSQDEHIATLKTERKTLLKTIDEMKRTICQCTKELCKYCDWIVWDSFFFISNFMDIKSVHCILFEIKNHIWLLNVTQARKKKAEHFEMQFKVFN